MTCSSSPTGHAQQLDALGAVKNTKIVVTSKSHLDEYAIASLAAAPVDAYGVGTQLVTGSGHPTCAMVYKMVARRTGRSTRAGPAGTRGEEVGGMRGKTSIGGRKYAVRRRSAPTAWPRPS